MNFTIGTLVYSVALISEWLVIYIILVLIIFYFKKHLTHIHNKPKRAEKVKKETN